jgi:hypothetical protein
MTALSAAELASYEEDGFVTIDTPLSSAALAAAEGAFDRLLGAGAADPCACLAQRAALEASTPVPALRGSGRPPLPALPALPAAVVG